MVNINFKLYEIIMKLLFKIFYMTLIKKNQIIYLYIYNF